MGLFGLGKKTGSDGGEEFGGIVINGIDFLEGKGSIVTLHKDKIVMKYAAKDPQNREYTLDFSKITSIKHTCDSEIIMHYKRSLIGGVVGGAIAGTAGAVIGSSPKEKKEILKKGSTIIEYVSSEGKEKCLVLSDSIENTFKAVAIYNKLKNLPSLADNITGNVEL